MTDFFGTYYHPGNALLTLVGDIDTQAGLAQAQHYFGWIDPGSGVPVPRDGAIGPRSEPARQELREPVPAEAYFAMSRAPADGTIGADALDVALSVLAGPESSRLVRRLVHETQLAQSVSAALYRLIGGTSVAVVQSRLRTGAPLAVVEAAILEEIEQLTQVGPTDDELAIAKAQLERAFLHDVSTCMGLADQVSKAAMLMGDVQHLNGTLDRINAVSRAHVQEALATWLTPNNRAVLTYHLDPPRAAATS